MTSIVARIRRWGACLAFVSAALCALPLPAENSAVIYLVRHAERLDAADNPGLTEDGRRRAGDLAALLADADVQRVYSTDFLRSRETAAPLASALGLEITIYDPDKLSELAATMLRQGGRYLVVGHSNTTPELVGALGGDPGPAIDEAAEYDRLYVVTVAADGSVSTDLRRYGIPYEP